MAKRHGTTKKRRGLARCRGRASGSGPVGVHPVLHSSDAVTCARSEDATGKATSLSGELLCPVFARGIELRGLCADCVGKAAPRRTTYFRQTPLYLEGSATEYLFAVVEGVLREVRTTEDGRTQPIRLLRPGEVAGFEALTSPSYHSTVEAVTQTLVCRVPVAEVREHLDVTPGASRRVLGELLAQVRGAGERLLWMGVLTAEERVLALLRLLTEHEEPGALVTVPLNRLEMAEFLGLAHATVSRIVQDLGRRGVIEIEGPRLAIREHRDPALSRSARSMSRRAQSVGARER